jgi:hypothetical protein
MSPSHTRRNENTKLSTSEISEDEVPEPGLPQPVFGTEEYIKVSKWQTNKVFMFLSATAATCITAVAVSPNVMVLSAAISIWVGALLLARYLLINAYRKYR